MAANPAPASARTVEDTVQRIVDDGAGHLHLIFDFDMTMTKHWVGAGRNLVSCHGVSLRDSRAHAVRVAPHFALTITELSWTVSPLAQSQSGLSASYRAPLSKVLPHRSVDKNDECGKGATHGSLVDGYCAGPGDTATGSQLMRYIAHILRTVHILRVRLRRQRPMILLCRSSSPLMTFRRWYAIIRLR